MNHAENLIGMSFCQPKRSRSLAIYRSFARDCRIGIHWGSKLVYASESRMTAEVCVVCACDDGGGEGGCSGSQTPLHPPVNKLLLVLGPRARISILFFAQVDTNSNKLIDVGRIIEVKQEVLDTPCMLLRDGKWRNVKGEPTLKQLLCLSMPKLFYDRKRSFFVAAVPLALFPVVLRLVGVLLRLVRNLGTSAHYIWSDLIYITKFMFVF